MSRADLDALIALAESHGCYLLVDETYRDLSYGQKLPAAASLSARAISVSSLSKAFGIPGIRIGWLVTRDAALYERFLAAKEQIAICGSVIDEAIARALCSSAAADFLDRLMPEMAERRDIVQAWIDAEPLVDWVRPEGGVVGFPRLNVGKDFDLDRFYARAARTARHLCRPGPLVRHAEAVLPRRLRLADGSPAARAASPAISAALREQN